MENTKTNTVLDYCNDVFFKYALSREDEGSVYARNTIIERVTGIKVKGKHRPQSESGSGHHRKEAHYSGCPCEG